MSIRDFKLYIDKTLIDTDAENIRLDELVLWKKDELPHLRFTQESTFPINTDKWAGKLAELHIDQGKNDNRGNPIFDLVFVGQVTRRVGGFSGDGWKYGYELLGIEHLMEQWPVVSPFDGTGSVTFNLSPTDTNYDPTYAGLSVARMILMLLEETSTRKHFAPTPLGRYWQDTAAAGQPWKIDQRTRDDLLNDLYLNRMVAPRPVTFSGDNLLQAIRNVLQSVAPNHVLWVQPDFEKAPGDTSGPAVGWGILRFADVTVMTTEKPSLMSEDPTPEVQRDYSRSFPRVVVRGGPTIKPCILSLTANDIMPDFTSVWYANNTAAINDWKLSTWLDRTQQVISGTCLNRRPRSASNPDEITEFFANSTDPSKPIPNPNYIPTNTDPRLASPSWLYVDPFKPLANNTPDYTWPAHYWQQDALHAAGSIMVTRKSPTNAQWGQSDVRDCMDNDQLIAGGQSHISVTKDLPFTDYSNFTLTARNWKGAATWRKYKINAKLLDGTPVAKRVQPAFPAPFPWIQSDGSVTSCTTTGVAQIFYTANATSNTTSSMVVGFQTDRQNECIIFDRPLPMCFGDQVGLAAGGQNVPGKPTEIKVLLPVSYGALETQCPHDTANTVDANYPIPNYQGTSYTVDGLTRTKYINNPDWVSDNDTDMVWQWGNQQLTTMCDTVVEGTATRLRYEPVIGPGTRLTWSDPCWPTGTFQFLNSDIRGCTIHWTHGHGEVPVVTTYQLSNRRDPFADQGGMVYHPCLYPQPQAGAYSVTGEASPYSTQYSMLSEAGKAMDSSPYSSQYSMLSDAGRELTKSTAEGMAEEMTQIQTEQSQVARVNMVRALSGSSEA